MLIKLNYILIYSLPTANIQTRISVNAAAAALLIITK